MSKPVLTYSPSDVKLVVSGYTLGGLVSISMSLNSAPLTIRRGIRGQNTRVYNPDLSGTIVVDVLQTSVTNDVLFEILNIDYRTQSARLGIALMDTSGRTLIQSDEAYITALPELTFSSGFNTRTWTIDMLSLIGGTITGSAGGSTDFFSNFDGAKLLNNVAGRVSDTLNSAVDRFL